MRLITEQRQSTRVQFQYPIQWQRVTQEEYRRLYPTILQYPTRERQVASHGNTETPAFLHEGARPIEIAILQSLRQLHQKLDRLLESTDLQRGIAPQMVGHGVDLSASGMRFTAEQEITREQHLLLSFVLPDEPSRSRVGASWSHQPNKIETLAKTVNIVREKQTWTVAVTFVAVHQQDQQALQEHCQVQRHQ